MRYTITTERYFCPHCKSVVKTKTKNDLWGFLAVAFLPITIIVFIVVLIVALVLKHKNILPRTKMVVCKVCEKTVAIGDYGTYLVSNRNE